MTDMSKEAMKLALEALENSVDLVREDAHEAEKLYGNYPTRQGKVGGLKVLADDHEKAITALREALALVNEVDQEQPAQTDWEAVAADQAMTIALLRAEQPAQQEPVAWRYDQAKYRENDLRGRQWAFNCFSQNKPWVYDMVRNLTPLYTSPPTLSLAQRQARSADTWVGLTDEEIYKMTVLMGINPNWKPEMEVVRSVVRNLEAKLREKNA